MCQSAEIGEKDTSSLANNVRALQGKAHRRDFGWGEDLDAKLVENMKQVKVGSSFFMKPKKLIKHGFRRKIKDTNPKIWIFGGK